MESKDFCDQLLIEIQTAKNAQAILQSLVDDGHQDYEEKVNKANNDIAYLWDLYEGTQAADSFQVNKEVADKLNSLKKFNDDIDRTALNFSQATNIIYFVAELVRAITRLGV